MANIGYRTDNGSTDVMQFNLGNLASSSTVPGAWAWAGRVLAPGVDGEFAAAPGFDPVDFYYISGGTKFGYYDGSSNAPDGPTVASPPTTDIIIVARLASATALRWSLSTNTGSGWSAFAHSNSATTFSNRTWPGSGVMEASGALNARHALLAHFTSALSDGEVATLTTDMAAWQAIASLANLWRYDQTPIVDLEGTATQNTLTGTSVTANGFPLDEGSAPAVVSRFTRRRPAALTYR